jgi:hypothetical protein
MHLLTIYVKNRVEKDFDQSTEPGEHPSSDSKPRPLCLTQDASRPSTLQILMPAKINHLLRLSKRFLAPGTNVLQRKMTRESGSQSVFSRNAFWQQFRG